MGYASGIKIADWAKAEQRKKNRAENRGRVRWVFGFLFGAAVLVFIYSDHTTMQNYIYSKVGPVLIKYADSSSLKASALKHESEVDEVNK
jgi:alpha/beta superfamily hydrolase